MKHSSVTFTTTLIAAVLAISGCASAVQQATATQSVAVTTEPGSPTHFDAQYEDNGIKVYITKVFPQYQMKPGQKAATQTIFMTSVLKNAGFQEDSHRIFHSVSDETAEMTFTPIIAGTRVGIARAAARENTNKVVGAVGAVAMFALSRGMSGGSTNALSNLGGLRDVVGTGMLKSANFKDLKMDQSNNNGIQVGAEDIIYVSLLEVKHSQKDNSFGTSSLYFVMPKEMKGEVLNGKNIHEYQYGSNFSAVLGRAVLKSANFIPSANLSKM